MTSLFYPPCINFTCNQFISGFGQNVTVCDFNVDPTKAESWMWVWWLTYKLSPPKCSQFWVISFCNIMQGLIPQVSLDWSLQVITVNFIWSKSIIRISNYYHDWALHAISKWPQNILNYRKSSQKVFLWGGGQPVLYSQLNVLLFAVWKMDILDTAFPSILQYKVYLDPDKGKLIADPAVTTTPTAFMFTTCCLFSMFYDRKFVEQNTHRGHTSEQIL